MTVKTSKPVSGTNTTTTAQSGSSTTTTTTTTSVTTSQYDNGIIDVSLIPYIPNIGIAFHARGLRPNRQVWFNLDGEDITQYIIKPDYIRLTDNASRINISSQLSVNNGIIRVGTGFSNVGTILQYGRYFDSGNANTQLVDTGDDRDRQRTLHVVAETGVFAPGQSITLSSTGAISTIDTYKSRGGANLKSWFSSNIANTVVLPIRTQVMANNYWGTDGSNNIIFIPGAQIDHPPLTSNIVGFNNVTQTLTLASAQGTLANLTIGITNPVSIFTSPSKIGWSIGPTFFTDDEGQISGILDMPAGTFRTGERIFRIIDDPDNDTSFATTYVDYKFDASGIQQTKEIGTVTTTGTTSVKTVTPVIVPVPTPKTPAPGPTDKSQATGWTGNGFSSVDPIAQSFYIQGTENPNGIYVTSVDIFFRSKDNILPAIIQIRPLDNGYPSSTAIIPNGIASVLAEHVNLSTDGSAATNFKFTTPVHLPPGGYALVVKSDSLEYEAFTAYLGETIIGSTRIVSAQPNLGSLFQSQNGGTWDAIQMEDLTFVLYQAVFQSSGSVVLTSTLPDTSGSDVVTDKFYAHMNDVIYNSTDITYQHSYPGESLEGYKLDNKVIPPARILFNSATQPYNLVATLTTTDTSISPVIYPSTAKLITYENYIDNANLAQSNFVIVNPLPGFTANANVGITINSANGSGAIAFGNANATGYLTSIILGSGGFGYTDNVTAYVGTNTTTISVASETNFSGGTGEAKYISRSVTLADGFDANDLKVYLTAYKPAGTDILVYYKIKAANDPDDFSRKPYVQMVKATDTDSPLFSYQSGQIEYEYDMAETLLGQGVTYTNGGATYTYFNQFAIKILLVSTDTRIVPVVYNVRAIALPL